MLIIIKSLKKIVKKCQGRGDFNCGFSCYVNVSFLVEFCYQTVYCWNFDSEPKIHINHFTHLACFNGNESFLKEDDALCF